MAGSLFTNLKYDIPASIVVFFVAVPLCLGIALASGAPLFSGIVAGIVGGIVVGIVSGSAVRPLDFLLLSLASWQLSIIHGKFFFLR